MTDSPAAGATSIHITADNSVPVHAGVVGAPPLAGLEAILPAAGVVACAPRHAPLRVLALGWGSAFIEMSNRWYNKTRRRSIPIVWLQSPGTHPKGRRLHGKAERQKHHICLQGGGGGEDAGGQPSQHRRYCKIHRVGPKFGPTAGPEFWANPVNVTLMFVDVHAQAREWTRTGTRNHHSKI